MSPTSYRQAMMGSYWTASFAYDSNKRALNVWLSTLEDAKIPESCNLGGNIGNARGKNLSWAGSRSQFHTLTNGMREQYVTLTNVILLLFPGSTLRSVFVCSLLYIVPRTSTKEFTALLFSSRTGRSYQGKFKRNDGAFSGVASVECDVKDDTGPTQHFLGRHLHHEVVLTLQHAVVFTLVRHISHFPPTDFPSSMTIHLFLHLVSHPSSSSSTTTTTTSLDQENPYFYQQPIHHPFISKQIYKTFYTPHHVSLF